MITRREALGAAVLAAAGAMLPRCRPRSGGTPVLGEADEDFLADQARRIVASTLLRAGASSGPYRNATPFDLRVPGGNMGYPAFWVRDAAMMLGGGLIAAPEVEGWIRLVAAAIPRSARVLRPGAAVAPAWSVPDHVNFDGGGVFYPGFYETGGPQGGPPFGKYPPLDDAFYFIAMVGEHRRLAGDPRLFLSRAATADGDERLDVVCDRAFRAIPVEPGTGLVTAGDPETENAKDWGFCDTVFKSGRLLFPSLLRIGAATTLAGLFEAAGDRDRAADYRRTAARTKAALVPAFFRPAGDGREGWLVSATGLGNRPDVWGSAFAVHAGALPRREADAVSRRLVRAYRDRTAVRGGFVRHIPDEGPPVARGWESTITPVDEYQNGGYWGVPVGWYASAVARTDPATARALARDFVGALRRDLREDGTTQAWEWRNPATGKRNNPLYAATVALPYLGLLEAGLLRRRR